MNSPEIFLAVLIGTLSAVLGGVIFTFVSWLVLKTTGKFQEWNEYGKQIDELQEQQEAVLDFLEAHTLTSDDEQVGRLVKKLTEIRAMRRSAAGRSDDE